LDPGRGRGVPWAEEEWAEEGKAMAGFLFILPPSASPWVPGSGRQEVVIAIVLGQLSREGLLLGQL